MKFKVGDQCVAETPNGLVCGIVAAGPHDSGLACVAYPYTHEGFVGLTYQKVRPQAIHKMSMSEEVIEEIVAGMPVPPRDEIIARIRNMAKS